MGSLQNSELPESRGQFYIEGFGFCIILGHGEKPANWPKPSITQAVALELPQQGPLAYWHVCSSASQEQDVWESSGSINPAAFSPQPYEVVCQCVGSPYPPVPLWGTVHLTYGSASAYHLPAVWQCVLILTNCLWSLFLRALCLSFHVSWKPLEVSCFESRQASISLCSLDWPQTRPDLSLTSQVLEL